MGVRRVLVVLLAALAGVAFASAGGAAQPATGTVVVTDVRGPITPVLADHVAAAVAVAERDGHRALVLELDTPGGLASAMEDIVRAMWASEVPVLVHVGPAGARAASAGALITFAANVASMAPGTSIGAATPVGIDGGDLGTKVLESAVAYATAIAEARGRDVGFVVATVEQGRAASASEAIEAGAVDHVVGSVDDLLEDVDGTSVTVASGRTVTLDVADAEQVRLGLTPLRRVLQRLADPNLVFVLLAAGALALLFELATPGIGVAGAAGVVLLVVAGVALSLLPVNVGGLALVALAAGLFVGEALAPGVGALAGGGALALGAGGLLLFQDASGLGLTLAILVPVPLVAGALAVAAGRLAWRSRHAPPTRGAAGTLVGAVAVVKDVAPSVQVVVEGARWQARTPLGTPLQAGQRVEVVAVEGLVLVVRPLDPAPPERGPAPPPAGVAAGP